MKIIGCSLLCALLLLPVALQAEDKIGDETIEARLKGMVSELRCLVCQNESLADSRSDLAVDLRNQIRDLVTKGMTDQQIIEYLVARYGDFVNFRPPLKPRTVPLWFGPFVLVALGGLVLMVTLVRRQKRVNITPLSRGEHERLKALVAKAEEDSKA